MERGYNSRMKKKLALMFFAFALGACDVWGAQPQPFPVWTPIPTRTPGIVTPTPIILTLTSSATTVVTVIIPVTVTSTFTETPSPTATVTTTPSETPTATPVQSLSADILGCNTSLDITHGMGEVTNAYVIIKNTGAVDLPNTCALLRALDEDREHPDKKVCIPNLPAQYQVTLKLTVDSAYKKDTLIQADVSSNDVLILRVDKPSCTDISLFGGAPSDLGVIKPIE